MLSTLQRATVTCPLCDCMIPPAEADRHHLVRMSKGGRRKESLHRVSYRQVHELLTEGELAGQYGTVKALQLDPELQSFVAWVKTKLEDFFVRTPRARGCASAGDSLRPWAAALALCP